MARHRILRVASRRNSAIYIREISTYDKTDFTPTETATLDAGGHVVRAEGTFVDLNAYYEASEAERGNRAFGLVS